MFVLFSGPTHRELFSDFYADVLREPLEEALAANPRPQWGALLFSQMLRDIMGGGQCSDPIEQVPIPFPTSKLVCLLNAPSRAG